MADARGFVQAVRLEAYGLLFLGILAGLVLLTIGLYGKSLPWQHHETVYLEVQRAGNQLNLAGDVKVRGVIVGDIRKIESQGDGARITLAISPKLIKEIPANVQARILPKTLFGEKFVDLVIPSNPAPEPLKNNDVITEDRSKTAIETGKVFDDLLPLLRTLQPIKLNATLNALASALEQRGNALGENFSLNDRYFADLNPHLPTIQHDISGLADLANSLGDASPDLLRLAANSAVSLQEVPVAKRQALVKFFTGTRGFANTMRRVLAENETNFIQLAKLSKPILGVFRKYSSEFPCLMRGLTDIQKRVEQTFATGPYLYVHLEIINRENASYKPVADKPRYDQYGPPNCSGLPQPGQKFTYPHPGVSAAVARANDAAAQATAYGDIGPVGSANEIDVVSALAGPLMDKAPREVPSFADLLLGPMLRGSAVSLR